MSWLEDHDGRINFNHGRAPDAGEDFIHFLDRTEALTIFGEAQRQLGIKVDPNEEDMQQAITDSIDSKKARTASTGAIAWEVFGLKDVSEAGGDWIIGYLEDLRRAGVLARTGREGYFRLPSHAVGPSTKVAPQISQLDVDVDKMMKQALGNRKSLRRNQIPKRYRR